MRSRHKSFRRRRSLVVAVFVLLVFAYMLWILIVKQVYDFILDLIGFFLIFYWGVKKTDAFLEKDKLVIKESYGLDFIGGKVVEIPIKDIEEIGASDPGFFDISFFGKTLPQIVIKWKKTKAGGFPFTQKGKESIKTTKIPPKVVNNPYILVSSLIEKARSLAENKNSQQFAWTYLPRIMQYIQSRKKTRKIITRGKGFLQFVLFLLLCLLLLLSPVSLGPYYIFVILFLSMLFIFGFMSKPTFAYLPSVPRNYWLREMICIGVLSLFALYLFNPYSAAIPLFLAAGWGSFSSAFYDKQRYIRTLKQGLIVILLIVVSFSYVDKIRPSRKTTIQTLMWISHTSPYPRQMFTVSPDGKSFAFPALDQSFNMPYHERNKAEPILDRIKSFGFFITAVKKISEKKRKDFGSCLVQIHLDSNHPEIEIWRNPLAREERLFPLILPLDSRELIAIKTPVFKDDTPTTPLLFSCKDYPPRQIPWNPGYTIKGTTQIAFYPNKAISPDKKRFAVYTWDKEKSIVYLSTFDVLTKNHIATKRFPLKTEDRASSSVSVIEWKNGLAVLEEKYLGKRYEELNKKYNVQWSSGMRFAASLEIKEPGKKVFQLWDVPNDKLVLEIPVKTRDIEGFEAFWANDETRVAVFHDYEILLIDIPDKEWKAIPVPNQNTSITMINGAWSWDGKVFYFHQPSILTGFFGGELKKVVWSEKPD
jgi:hypothetical protein